MCADFKNRNFQFYCVFNKIERIENFFQNYGDLKWHFLGGGKKSANLLFFYYVVFRGPLRAVLGTGHSEAARPCGLARHEAGDHEAA